MASVSNPNAPISDELRATITALEEKTLRLKDVTKDIKENPDERVTEVKQLKLECRELKQMIVEQLEDEQVVLINRRKFKRRKVEKVKYSKENVHGFITDNTDSTPEQYDKEYSEETIVLGAVKKM